MYAKIKIIILLLLLIETLSLSAYTLLNVFNFLKTGHIDLLYVGLNALICGVATVIHLNLLAAFIRTTADLKN